MPRELGHPYRPVEIELFAVKWGTTTVVLPSARTDLPR
jgi:hypothetical protein